MECIVINGMYGELETNKLIQDWTFKALIPWLNIHNVSTMPWYTAENFKNFFQYSHHIDVYFYV